jgi:undecaprenyl pyrophosphate phosphatase UppP
VTVDLVPLIVGMVAALVAGLAAIHFMLQYLRTRSLDIFVWYRFGLAALVLLVGLSR